ncbi:pectinesterase-like [Arachis stenosperma]|uniref:pectinesterase-like n=1 Tax=Arachis stenosperma TaxID=217475 RepID=UPI0025ACE728|nr:pectinesterase-like [Arachis stenosperma]
MKGKVIISATCLILVVGVVIGAVLIANKKDDSGADNIELHDKAIATMCQNVLNQTLCRDILGPVKGTTDPNEFIAAAVKAATESVIKALNMSDRLTVEKGNGSPGIKMALEDCKDLLQSAMDSLQLSTSLVDSKNIQTIHDQSADFKNWLGAVISYQQTCLDNFNETDSGEKVIKEQLNAETLDQVMTTTGLTLDILADLDRILDQFNLKIDVHPGSRRLLAADVDDQGLPTWLSASDRDLLAEGKGKGKAIVAAHVVVAQDGSGRFRTIKEAIDSYPPGFKGRYVIYVKAGVYNEYIIIPKHAVNILMYGDGPTRTIVTGRKNFVEGVKTMHTATFANTADGFIAKAMRFENTAGPKGHQAVALRNQGDKSAFFQCQIFGNQDTLYVQTNRQFYRDCEISGTIDFIFGTSPALIQNSKIILRKPDDKQFNTVTADGTTQPNMPTGIVLQNCEIVPEPALFPARFTTKSYLGRPWKPYSKTLIMESMISDAIHPEGWFPWAGTVHLDTLWYAEYANTGPGANVQGRIKWKGYHGLISRNEAARFTAAEFLRGGPTSAAEPWLSATGIPFTVGFTRA